MKKALSIFTLGIVLILSACQKETGTPNDNPDKSIRQLNISPGFDWKTTHNVSLTLTGYASSAAEITNPDGDLIQKVFLKKNEPYTTQLVLPKATKSIKLNYMGQTVDVEISGTSASYLFN
jgi:hypothetical protein